MTETACDFQGWNDELDARLRDMAPTHSASQIAQILGTTRNAVIGRCGRRKIDLASAASKVQRQPVVRLVLKGVPPAPKRPTKFKSFGGEIDPAKVDQIAAERAARRDAIAATHLTPISERVSFLDIGARQCRWPLWTNSTPFEGKFFCGQPTLPGRPYCQHCAALSVASPNVRADMDRRTSAAKARAA